MKPATIAAYALLAATFLTAMASCTYAVQLDSIKLPPGFQISVYTDKVPGARSMTLGADGTLFVGTRDEGAVYAVLDKDKDGKADQVVTVARGLDEPNGVAYRGGSLYVAEISRILRYDDIERMLHNPGKPVVVYDKFPDKAHHGWKFIRFGPDGKLYVPVGAPCNSCDEGDPFASITRMDPDGGNFEIFARGIRNTVGFDWDPDTGELWFTDNGRDWLGDDLPPDELNRVPRPGMHFGFPYCYGVNVPDPEYGEKCDPKKHTTPEMELGAHVAALGMRFYDGAMFPEKYRGRIFIAEHGSWNRSVAVGYRVVCVKVEGGKAVSQEVFASGWLSGGSAWGRPVDVQVMPDGALLVSDDHAGAVYRITYKR
ncbi:MAG: sorbosone dehydrogenase family protein [Nitrospirae bacterium]|nr:sorbosone dehydrogenase family protein [Nitrospirota bacterium]